MGKRHEAPTRFKDCRSVPHVLGALKAKGITPSENALVGTVYPVHTFPSSMHYKIIRGGKIVDGPKKLVTYQGRQIWTPQGNLGVDINDNDLRDDHRPFDTEAEALEWVYRKFLEAFGPRGYDVLDELFFDGFGWIKETPTANHPIPGHEGHAHAGFKAFRW